MATQYSNARIVTDGIVLALNAADPNSYVSGSSTWFDLSGNNLTGSLINTPTYSASNSGNFIFNGTNQNADLSNPSVLNVHLAFTLSTWFKLSASANYQALIARGRGSGQWDGYELGFNGGTRTLRVSSENAAGSLVTFDLVSNRVVDDGNWHYGVFTFNGTTGIMYVDGTTAGSSTGYFNSNSYTNYVGRRAAGQYFSGSIANVGIYNRALASIEVQQNFNAQKARFGFS
jgi:hypothetical protein